MPALATIGARLTPSTARISMKAIVNTTIEVTLRSTEPTVSAR